MISNPVTFFINDHETRSFTYEGGSKLFHWSPYESDLSKSMECNVVFFANDEDHARDVLRRMFEFWINCNNLYRKSTRDIHSVNLTETRRLKSFLREMDKMRIELAPINQFLEVGWASNDNLHV
jgi:hypothetical protein